jgi:DNA replication protein DnaC
MHLEQTICQLQSMRLAVMAQSLKTRLSSADANGLSHEEFLALVVQDEFDARHSRKLNRMVCQANFKPEQACIENISYSPPRGFQKKDIMTFTSPAWINNAQNVVITGPTGTGKTYIAEAIGLRACHMGYSAVKIRYKMLFENIDAAKGTGTFLKFLQNLHKTKVLIIDDFLMDPVSPAQLSDLMEIVEERNQKMPIVITTQYPTEKWHSLLPDPTVADAVCDRIIHTAIHLNLDGDSMRKKPKNA